MGYLLSKLKKLFSNNRSHTDLVPDRSVSNHPPIDKLETKIPYQSTPDLYEKSTNDTGVDTNSDLGSKTEVIVEKTKDFISNTGKEVVEQGSALWEIVKDQINDLDEKTQPYREKIKEKTNEAVEKVKDFVDEKVEAAKKLEAEEAKLDADKDGLADKPVDFGKSATEKHGDFFNKAEDWLKKQEAKENAKSDNTATNSTQERLELPKE
jgi:ElaB/YqjD/DUF883 family membrane-anchored ribosome-binding protein